MRQELQAGEDSRKNWRRINEVDAELSALAGLVGALRATVAELRGQVTEGGRLHPFKVYRLPQRLRAAAGAADWRSFRVRSGQVMGVEATGTDGAAAPDGDSYPDVTDIVVPESVAEFCFWLEDDGADWVLRWGDDPTADSYDGTGTPTWGPSDNPWTVYPEMDGTHVLLATVDTSTNVAEKVAVVRQLVRQDLVSLGSGAGAYRGEWDVEAVYVVGDVVRKRTGSGLGVWVAVVGSTGASPVYPEPVDAETGTNTWELLAFCPVEITRCVNGSSETLHINGTTE